MCSGSDETRSLYLTCPTDELKIVGDQRLGTASSAECRAGQTYRGDVVKSRDGADDARGIAR